MKKSYKKTLAGFLVFASITGLMLYYYISMNIEANRLSRVIDDLKQEIKLERSAINSNKAVLDKLVSKEYLVPMAAEKFNLKVAVDSLPPLILSGEEVRKFEEKINTLSE